MAITKFPIGCEFVFFWKCSGSRLDDCVDGVTLLKLLELDENMRRDTFPQGRFYDRATYFTELQLAKISGHWMKQLREKQLAVRELERERDRNQVVVDLDW